MSAREVKLPYDSDLIELHGEALDARLDKLCECGHLRSDHYAATGALGSFGGSACERCWTCPTFQPSPGVTER